jgi:DNA-binding transcriptional MerR regulator
VSSSAQFLNPSEAAKRLGVSAKALRLYEQRGLIAPARTAAGWRAYGPDERARVAEIATLRELGLSLSQVAPLLGGDSGSLEPALAAHQSALEVAFINSSTLLIKSAAYGPTSPAGGHRPPANSRAYSDRRPTSASCSTFRGLGVANGLNCKTSAH